MTRWLGGALIGLGLALTLGVGVPMAMTEPPMPPWWLYLFVAGLTIAVWATAFVVPSRWRLRASVFAGFVTLWSALVATGLDWAPAFH